LVSFDQIHDRPISSIISHPTQCDIFMTASYDGDVKICDIASMRLEVLHGTAHGYEDATYRVPSLPFNVDGCKIMQTFNGKPQISESCWQRSDTIVVARKSGHISLINAAGFEDPIFRDAPPGEAGYAPVPAKKWRCRVWGSGSADQVLPEDHFFLFEKRKLKWDQWGTAVDEVTEARTHLMPRGPLCNRHYESYEAFGYDAGIWEQVPFGMLQGVAGQQFLNGGDGVNDDDNDDETLVQPLPIGGGRRVVDVDSESGDSCVTPKALIVLQPVSHFSQCRYNAADESEMSDSSSSLSINDDWSSNSSDDGARVRDRRRSTVFTLRPAFIFRLPHSQSRSAPPFDRAEAAENRRRQNVLRTHKARAPVAAAGEN